MIKKELPKSQRSGQITIEKLKDAASQFDPVKLVSLYLDLNKEEKGKAFLSVGEAAEQAGVSARTIGVWITCGYIIAINRGVRRKLIYRPSLVEFMKLRQVEHEFELDVSED